MATGVVSIEHLSAVVVQASRGQSGSATVGILLISAMSSRPVVMVALIAFTDGTAFDLSRMPAW
jgi:hypothetical protein